jgi:intein/homing endonuclease
MADGTWKPIEKIRVGDYVASRNNKNQLIPRRVTLEYDNGIQDVYRIKLSNGLSIDCTSNHPLLVLDKADDCMHIHKVWKSIDDGLSPGIKTVVMNNYEVWGDTHNPLLGALVGYLLTDGYIVGDTQTPKFTNNNFAMIEEVRDIVKALFDYDCTIRHNGNGWDIHLTDGDKRTENLVSSALRELGLLGLKSSNKTLPDAFMDWDKETIMHCINRMFSGYGGAHCYKASGNRMATELMLCSTSYDIIEQVRLILMKVGIIGTINQEGRTYKGRPSILYKLRISESSSIENFFEHVGYIYGKEEQCESVLNAVKHKAKRRRSGSKQFRYITIKSIEHIGKAHTYDIGVDTTHNFVANGIICHNTGKCIPGYSGILTSNGSVSAEVLYKLANKPPILTFDEHSQSILHTSDYTIWANGIKPVYRITTKSGRINYATGNHPYLIIDNDGKFTWLSVDELNSEHRIAVPSSYEGLINGTTVGSRLSRLLGYLVGDANTSQKQVTFTNFDSEIINDFRDIVSEYDCHLDDYGKTGNYQVVTNIPNHNKVIGLCREHGLMGKLATNKEVPAAIMNGTTDDIVNFIGAYWDCDGWVSISNKTHGKHIPNVEIGISSSSEKLARGVQHLLLRIGISAALKPKKVKYKGEYRYAWQLTISDAKNISKFVSTIPLKAKCNKFADIMHIINQRCDCGKSYTNTIPRGICSYVQHIRRERSIPIKAFNCKITPRCDVSREKLLHYSSVLSDEYLNKLATNNIIWDEIVSIDYVGEEETYDLSVPITHTFIADDIISHNTWTLAGHMLWYAFTHEDAALIVATPYENQITVIFDQLRKFIAKAPELSESVSVDRRNPQHIQFKNRSYIKGFTAGKIVPVYYELLEVLKAA